MVHIGRFSTLYMALVAAVAVIAILERVYARRNEARLLSEGAEEVAPWVFRLMAPVYSLTFPAAVGEQLLMARRPPLPFAASMVLLFLLAKGLKLWAIHSLGNLWTMRVILPRPFVVVSGGPYRFLRHPNYVAGIFEATALPLAGRGFFPAVAGGALVFALPSARRGPGGGGRLGRPAH